MKVQSDQDRARWLLARREQGGVRANSRRLVLVTFCFCLLLAVPTLAGYGVVPDIFLGLFLGIFLCLLQRSYNTQRNWTFNEKIIDWNVVRKLSETEPTGTPPTLEPPSRGKPSRKYGPLTRLAIGGLVFTIVQVAITVLIGAGFFGWLFYFAWIHGGPVKVRLADDAFRVKILSLKSEPNVFSEQIKLTCRGDMNAGIYLTDIKKAGIFPAQGTNAELFYRLGHPKMVGESAAIQAQGDFSTCEIQLRITTTATNTLWHSGVAGGSTDTTISTPLKVTAVQTNWPGSYTLDSALPLCDLGDCKVLISVQ